MKRINIYTVKQVRESSMLYNIDTTSIDSPKTAVTIINKVFSLAEEAVEVFGILTLNSKNKIVGAHIISVGTLNIAVVHPREVFKPAILNNAAQIIIFHNHPSGDSSPSKEDIVVTQKLVDAGKLLGIEIIDHLIISENDQYFAFSEKGLLNHSQ